MAKKTKAAEVDPRIRELYEAAVKAVNDDGFVYGRRKRIIIDFYGQQHVFDAIVRSSRQVVYLLRPERDRGDVLERIWKLTPNSFEYDGNGVMGFIWPDSKLWQYWFPVVAGFEQPEAAKTVQVKKGTAVQLSMFG